MENFIATEGDDEVDQSKNYNSRVDAERSWRHCGQSLSAYDRSNHNETSDGSEIADYGHGGAVNTAR